MRFRAPPCNCVRCSPGDFKLVGPMPVPRRKPGSGWPAFTGAGCALTLVNCSHCCVCFRLARRNADFASSRKKNRVRRPACGWWEERARRHVPFPSAAKMQVSRTYRGAPFVTGPGPIPCICAWRFSAPTSICFIVPAGSALLLFSKGCHALSAKTRRHRQRHHCTGGASHRPRCRVSAHCHRCAGRGRAAGPGQRKEVGGMGLGLAEAAQVVERIAKACPSTAMVVRMHYSRHHRAGEIRQRDNATRDRRRPPPDHAGLVRHRLPQPLLGAGRHRARRTAMDVILDGSKTMVTSACEADSYVWSTSSGGR